ncbi:hypothetical protein FHS16_003707 [Paenibacillus endophyticus]|uniref:Uncharacterized protein n=1 Tax=Paenibacillus endophyticus TaxID=1294268 RepID=A0A7W5C9K3_9BACL|nr:hypothetical protein [Paenibacillus endophyticus]
MFRNSLCIRWCVVNRKNILAHIKTFHASGEKAIWVSVNGVIPFYTLHRVNPQPHEVVDFVI